MMDYHIGIAWYSGRNSLGHSAIRIDDILHTGDYESLEVQFSYEVSGAG